MAWTRRYKLNFFFASINNRINQNHVTKLVFDSEIILQSRQEIEEEIIVFYKRLLGSDASELPGIHPQVMASDHVLTTEQQLHLQFLITREEATYALKDINDLKAPGCDGFNAYFLKKSMVLHWN